MFSKKDKKTKAKPKTKSVSSFEIDNNEVADQYQLLNADADEKKYDGNHSNNNHRKQRAEQTRVHFEPHIVSIDDSLYDDERKETAGAVDTGSKATKNGILAHHTYQTREQKQMNGNFAAITHYCNIAIFASIVTGLVLFLSDSNMNINGTQMIVFCLTLILVPIIFILVRLNILLIHNLYIAKYIEPLFIFCVISGNILLSIFMSNATDVIGDDHQKLQVLQDYNLLSALYGILHYFIFRFTSRLWIFFYRLQFRKFFHFWLLTVYAFAHSLIIFSYWNIDGHTNKDENIQFNVFVLKDYIEYYILRSYLLLIWLCLIVYHSTFILNLFFSSQTRKLFRHRWIAFAQLFLFSILMPVLYKVLSNSDALLFYVVNGLLIVPIIELWIIAIYVWILDRNIKKQKVRISSTVKFVSASITLCAIIVQSVTGIWFWKESEWVLIDLFAGSALVWFLFLFGIQYFNMSYIAVFTNFYTRKILSEFNFLDDESLNKMHDIFVVKYYKYGNGLGFGLCCKSQRFVNMSSDICAPWTDNYRELNDNFTKNIMIGIQSTTSVHFAYKLKSNMIYNNFVTFQRKQYLKKPKEIQSNNKSNQSANSENVSARYIYGDNHSNEPDLEVMFENLGFSMIEYFPTKFADIRSWFDISSADYIRTFEYNLLEFITNSKSGMYFFYTFDGKYLVKSLKRSEFVFFQKIFDEYYQFLKLNPNSFVNKFFGMYQIRSGKQRNYNNNNKNKNKNKNNNAEENANNDICFVIMESIFYSDLNVTKIYDLKGSTKGRELSEKEKLSMKVPVLKDLDFINDGSRIHIGDVVSKVFVEQLERDVEFLHELKIMDYSLLLGMVYRRSKSEGRPQKSKDLMEPYLFRYDHGGIAGVGDNANELYFCGLIDILQRFSAKKRVENVMKRIASNQKEISCAPPKVYADRMVDFLQPYIV